MSWSTGYTKYKEQFETAKKVMSHVGTLNIDIGTPVLYQGTIYKVKQLWITEFLDSGFSVRVELDDSSLEDYMFELDEIQYGPAVTTLFGESCHNLK